MKYLLLKSLCPLPIITQEYQLLHSFQLHWLNTAKACQAFLPDRRICSSICSAHTDCFASAPEENRKRETAVGYTHCRYQLKCFWFASKKKKKISIYLSIYLSMPHKDATVLELLTGRKQHYHHQESWSFMKIKAVERCFKTDLFVAIFETFGKIPPTPWVSLEVFLGVCFWASMENLVLENKTCTTVGWTRFKKETLLSSVP